VLFSPRYRILPEDEDFDTEYRCQYVNPIRMMTKHDRIVVVRRSTFLR
jgi:hypothetical protein